jgi:hypothetical protein
VTTADLYGHGLYSLSLPASIASEVDVSYNYLTEFTLPAGLTSLGSYMYSYNSLTRLAIPAGVTSIDPDALFGQNPWGDDLENGNRPNENIYSNDPAIAQRAYDSIWYVRAYTANPSNPHGLTDFAISEYWDVGDGNQNGTMTDSLGGHIINPASTVVKYQDNKGNAIAPDVTVTGIKTGKTPSSAIDSSDYLHSYLVTESAIPAPLDPYDPTPEELTAMELGFSQYYRMGDSVTFSPKSISGYVAPSAQTVSLDQEDNVVTFTYARAIASVSFATNSVAGSNLVSSTPPAGVQTGLITQSSLSLGGGDCGTIESASLLSPSSITDNTTNLPSGVSVLGGVDFSVSCAAGGETGIDYILGAVVQDTSKLMVYKYSTATKKLTDITDKVSFSSQTVDGTMRTVISYDILDGGELDEDGTVNGTIQDPIVIGYAGDIAELAETGASVWTALLGGALLLGAGLCLLRLVLPRQTAQLV